MKSVFIRRLKAKSRQAPQPNRTNVLAAFWTVRSLQPLAAQQANSSRLVGRRLWTIYHRALSLSLVAHTWMRQLNVVGEYHRWPSCNRRPGTEVPSRSVPSTPVWRSGTWHGVGLAASVVLMVVRLVCVLLCVKLRATGWRPSVADWGGGLSAICKLWVQLFAAAGNGWPHSVLRYH